MPLNKTISEVDRAISTAMEGLPDKIHGEHVSNGNTQAARFKTREVYSPDEQFAVMLETVPVTTERVPYLPSNDSQLRDAGTARANIAASQEAPHGTTEAHWAEKHQKQSVLQQHCAYFDQDGDGVIWPSDTYNACRKWGWHIFLAALATFIINFNLSYPTSLSWIPDPFFRIWITNIHKDKHGSDSMSYDNEGRFRSQNLEDMFAKYNRGNKGGLDVGDLLRMHKGQRMVLDFFGQTATILEWLAVYLLLWPEDGILRKEDVRRVFDGSIFQRKADEYAKKKRMGQLRKAHIDGPVRHFKRLLWEK
ncbi:Peroxygenase [Fulvia fulva]|uniref:Peroxygenase n=1 Tax=Passalora fulva TaxID=5499 RepID=A0A9Q8LGZ9_PASFU|nr:Peroxygenase [Fulvia fulva]KAK4623758.1 Peroxygenase [Fulvia fulva]KAK4625944.1 Peroxygenase [Fulvia fulva]UJO17287.1 Peroxygenase [Fulvia fulva]WPV15564.1 Peroxygenase [Fulvia fulva]WPV30328.1 Peroxygenase [Fulvia fulva]